MAQEPVRPETQLTVARLIEAGFTEFDSWLSGEGRLHPPRNLPPRRGVYAFAIDDLVMYVGLASRSIKQRLGFYSRPGSTQPTNIRLNETILGQIGQGHVVRVLIAHPPDLTWNGLRMSGSEALEAALIEDFCPSWNKKGSSPSARLPSVKPTPRIARTTKSGGRPEQIVEFVRTNPRCTELQIARGVFGPAAVQPQANPYCRKLVELGQLERLATRPVTYLVR